MSEHEFEPVPGLPERLPGGERMLWQGAPSWRALAVRALHVRKVALYFALLSAWHVVDTALGGADWLTALRGASWLVVLGAAACGVLTLLAWALAHSTLYTVTTSRVVMRFGIALPMAMNLPFRVIESAGIVRHRDGTSDLPLTLLPGERVGYLVTWPHVRPWRFMRVQPMLRGLPQGERVAGILAAALTASLPATARATTAPSEPAPSATRQPSLTVAA